MQFVQLKRLRSKRASMICLGLLVVPGKENMIKVWPEITRKSGAQKRCMTSSNSASSRSCMQRVRICVCVCESTGFSLVLTISLANVCSATESMSNYDKMTEKVYRYGDIKTMRKRKMFFMQF